MSTVLDRPESSVSRTWNAVGAAWFVLLALSFSIGGRYPFWIAAAGGVLALIALAMRTVPPPRRHPVYFASLLAFVVAVLASLLSGRPGESIRLLLAMTLPGAVIVFAAVTLLRERWSLAVGLGAVFVAAAVTGIITTLKTTGMAEGDSAWVAGFLLVVWIPTAAVAWNLKAKTAVAIWMAQGVLLFLVGLEGGFAVWVGAALAAGLLVMVMKRADNRAAPVVGVVVFALLYFISALSNHLQGGLAGIMGSSGPEKTLMMQLAIRTGLAHPLLGAGFFGADPGNDWLYLWASTGVAGLAASLLVVFHFLREGYKDHRRWKEPSILQGLYLGAVLTVPAVLTGAWSRGFIGEWLFTAAWGLVIGLGLAARERLIREDPTRSPRRRPVSPKSHLGEYGIAARALASGLTARLRKSPEMKQSEGERRIVPESGNVYCPYETGEPTWVPVCMHLHSNRWEGAFTPREVVEFFAALGAGAVILTDHNRVTTVRHSAFVIPAYEHGWGPHHHHLLALGASRALAEHHPFGGSISSRNETIRRLRNVSQFIILAHPLNKDAWSAEDVTSLDFDALEIFNKSALSEERWDEALSAGKLVWATAGDDCHDLRSRHQTGKRFILLDSAQDERLDEENLLTALKAGRFVSVWWKSHEPTETLPPKGLFKILRFAGKNDSLTLYLDRTVEKVEIIGENGRIFSELQGVSEVEITLPEGAAYRRVVVYDGSFRMALNPLVRVVTT